MRKTQPNFGLAKSASEPSVSSLSRTLPATVKGSFLPRQMGHPTIAARRNLAQQRKALIKETRDLEDCSFWGAQGIPGFAAHLKSRFGSILAGWRLLDSDKKGRLSFHPFCKAARKWGYHGNVKKLWTELDATGKGFVTLADVDPDVWNMVSSFKIALMQRYGDMLVAWQDCIDVNGAGKVSESEIADSLRELGLEMDARQLLKMFISMPGATHITLKDFDPRAYVRWQTSELPTLSKGDDAEEGANTPKVRVGTDRGRLGVSTKEAFQSAMISQFGSLFRAWREGLDPTGRDRLSWGEFTHVFRLLGLHGDLQSLWDQLDTEGIGVLRFSDLDEATASIWSEMRACFEQEYGNMLRAWMTGADVEGVGHVDEDQFVAACKKAGFLNETGAQDLFYILRPPGCGSFLSLRDFDRKAFKAFLRNDFRMLSEPTKKPGQEKPLLSLSIEERTERGFFFQIRRGWQFAKSPDFSKKCRTYTPPKQELEPVEDFIGLCTRKYGSMVAAWRFGLDPTGSGSLNFNEFCNATRRTGYRGSLRSLWAELCGDRNLLRLKDLDFESSEAVTRFFETIHLSYEDLATVWVEIFKKDPYASLSMEDLSAGCKALGFPEDLVETLFLGLHPNPGQSDSLFLWDLEDMFVTTRRLWELKKPKSLRRPVLPVGTSLLVAAEVKLKPEEADEEKVEDILKHELTPQLVREAMARDFVSTAACWVTELDWRGRGSVTSQQFFELMHRLGCAGNLRKLWAELTGDRGVLRFVDIDPKTQKLLEACRRELLQNHGTLMDAWYKGIDPHDLGIVDLEDFKTACERVLPTLKPKEVASLFGYLLARHGQRSLRKEDLKALLIGVAPEECEETWGEGMEAEKSVSVEDQARLIDSAEGFKAMLLAKHGSFFAAWVYALDRERNGFVAKQDFSLICRRLGVQRVSYLWREFMQGQKGGILTLEIFDAETAQSWSELHHLLLQASASFQKSKADAATVAHQAADDQAAASAADPAAESEHFPPEPSADASADLPTDPPTTGPITDPRADTVADPAGPADGPEATLDLATLPAPAGRSRTPLPSLKEGWRVAFDPQHIRRVGRQRFFEGCKSLGYPKDANRLFDVLRPDPHREYLVFEDIVGDLNPNDFALRLNPDGVPFAKDRYRTLEDEEGKRRYWMTVCCPGQR